MLALNIVFAITASVASLFIIGDSSMGQFAYNHPPSFHHSLVSVAFLLVWLLYGLILGYLRKKNFIKFISVFWGVGGSHGMMGLILPSRIVERLEVLGLFGVIIIYGPIYGLGYFIPLNPELPFFVYCLILSWSSGALGYLLGALLSKLVPKVPSRFHEQ